MQTKTKEEILSPENIERVKKFMNPSGAELPEDSSLPLEMTVFYVYEDDGSLGYQHVYAKSAAEACLKAITKDADEDDPDGMPLEEKLNRQPAFAIMGWHTDLLNLDYPVSGRLVTHPEEAGE